MSLENFVSTTIARIAGQSSTLRSRADVLVSAAPELLATPKVRRRAAEMALQLGRRFAKAQKVGRAGMGLVLALALDGGRLARAERSEILASSNPLQESRAKILEFLRRLEPALLSDLHPLLSARIETYETLERAARLGRSAHADYVALVRARPLGLIKALVAAADLAFLAKRVDEDARESIEALYTHISFLHPVTPEEWTCVVSRCVTDIVQLAPPRRDDCDAEVAKVVQSPWFHELVAYAVAKYRFDQATGYVVLFGYELVEVAAYAGPVFVLSACEPAIEESYRRAFIREELVAPRKNPLLAHVAQTNSVMSMSVVAQRLLKIGQLSKASERPYHRYVLKLPDPEGGAFDDLLGMGPYFEDLATAWGYSDWAVTPSDFLASKIGETLTVDEFLRGLRPLRFFLELHTAMLSSHAHTDPIGVWNSALPVIDDTLFQKFLGKSGLSTEQQAELIGLLCWDGVGFLDIQYTPLIRFGTSVLVAARILLASDLVRNLMALNHKRVTGAGATFPQMVANALMRRFAQVAVGRPLKGQAGSGDIDVAVIVGNVLVILECKHSLLGASAHEHADAWNDVIHAAEQLEKCVKIIDEIGLQTIVQKWFPGNLSVVESVLPVVLSSTRAFFGLQHREIAVRDWQTLRNVLDTGEVEVAVADLASGTISGHRWSVYRENTFTPQDLLNYFSPECSLLRVQNAFLSGYSLIEIPRLPGMPMLVRSSFVANVPNDLNEHVSEYASLGLRDLGPFTSNINRLAVAADFDPKSDP